MNIDALWQAAWPLPPAWRGALAALATATAWAGVLRLLNRRDLATLGPALGLAVAWAVTLGLPFASPRQLAERLPLLALACFVCALLLTLLAAARASTLALGAAMLLAAGAWWLAGGPMTTGDLRSALVPVLALAAAAAVASLELRSPLRCAVAFALALAALWIARPAGPWPVLAAAGLAASLGGLPAAAPWTAVVAATMALALTGLAAGPVLARGIAADWTAAASPFAALALGPALTARIGGRRAGPPIAWTVAGGVPLLITWLLSR
jgi:hypothetical protein